MGIFDFLNLGLPVNLLIILLASWLLAILIGLVCHEFAHAFIAYKMGDDTARLMGRMSLNPLAHFDVAGGICLLFFGFGWAKPVPIDVYRFKNRRAGEICVSIAGIVANIILAIIFTFFNVLIYSYLNIGDNNFFLFLHYFTLYGALINIMLAAFNILPIYPLDGYNLITSIFKIPYMCKFDQFMRQFGAILLLCIIIIPIMFGYSFLGDAVNWIFNNLYYLFSLILVR